MINLSKDFSIDSKMYANQGNSDIGIRGSGKTHTATKTAEDLMTDGIPIVVFDPSGVWQNLRYGVGNKAGFPIVVAGGSKPDLELTEFNAVKILEAALKENVSIVFDLEEIGIKSKWVKIVSDCIEYLMANNKKYGLRHVFFEEAAEFVPQKLTPSVYTVYSHIERMARIGRNHGLGYTLINQRSQEIAKAIFELCDRVFVHKQTGTNSLKTIEEWLKLKGLTKSEIVKSLPKLQPGQCWVIDQDGEHFVKVAPKKTFHPDPQKGTMVAPIKSKTDVSSFIKSMTELIKSMDGEKQVENTNKKATNGDIDKLKTENSDLKNKLLFANGQLDVANQMNAKLLDRLRKINSLSDLKVEPSKIPEPEKAIIKTIAPLRVEKPIQATTSRPSSGQGRILHTCAMFHPKAVSKTRIGLIADLSPSSGSFNTYLSNLKREGLIEVISGEIKITEDGLQKVGDVPTLPSGDELVNMWCSHVGAGSGAGRILKYLANIFPKSQSKIGVADAVELSASSGSFNTYLSTLKRNSLIQVENGALKASEELFQ